MQFSKIKTKFSSEIMQKIALLFFEKEKESDNSVTSKEVVLASQEAKLDSDDLVQREKKIHAKKILKMFKDLDKALDKKDKLN